MQQYILGFIILLAIAVSDHKRITKQLKQPLMRKADIRFVGEKGPWGIPEHRGSISLNIPVAPVPPGCYKYYFDAAGNFKCTRDTTVDEDTLPEDVIFWCVASNDQNATRKFNTYQIKQSKVT